MEQRNHATPPERPASSSARVATPTSPPSSPTIWPVPVPTPTSATTPPVRHKSQNTDNRWFVQTCCKVHFNQVFASFFPSLPVPCCPENVTISLVSTETLEVMWSPVKGAELYETTAEQTNDVIHCNDTAPVCALSDLACNTAYSVTVTPCNDLRGCNRTCTSHTHETGKDMAQSQHRQKEGWKEQ